MAVIAELRDGLVLRTASAESRDLDGLIELGREAHGAEHVWGIRALFADPGVGPDRTTVVTDGERIVSTLCLMRHTFRFGDVEVPVGRPEYVATAPGFQRQGLIAAQFDVVHRWSAERGDLLQMITGIPYFYRRFGYEHGVDFIWFHTLDPDAKVTLPEGWVVRVATHDDLPSMRDLRRRATGAADVWVDWTDGDWSQLLDDQPDKPLRARVALLDGEVRGMALTVDEGGDSRVRMAEVAADSMAAVTALVAAVREEAGGRRFEVAGRPGTIVSAFLADHGRPQRRPFRAYIRAPEPVPLLDRLRPELSRRLCASPLGGESGELVLSLYERGVRLTYERGEVLAVEPAPGVEDPSDHGGVGVPPDLVATLLMGRCGAEELEERFDDVTLGRQRSLMGVLFPRLRADVLVVL